MKYYSRQHIEQHGFSLIELAIVLFIVALLLGGLLVPLTAQIDQQKSKETQKTLAELKEVLIGFAIVNGRLPCPATLLSSGLESYVAAVGASDCTTFFNGYVPAVTLGMTPVNTQGLLIDGWNNPIRYAVSDASPGGSTKAFTRTNGMKTATIGSLAGANLLYVCTSANVITPTTCGTAPKLTDSAPALLYSLGKNGTAGGVGADEAANTNGDPVFVSHDLSAAGAVNGEFDDIVVWISPNTLISRMVSAGQLP